MVGIDDLDFAAAAGPSATLLWLPSRVCAGPAAASARIGAFAAAGGSAAAGGAVAMQAEPLHCFLREGLLAHLRRELAGVDGPIGCEHSSGIDSNAVLGALVRGMGMPTERRITSLANRWDKGARVASICA